MTNDQLAVLAGAVKRRDDFDGWYYVFSDKIVDCRDWRPGTFFDDCRPLLEKIEREGLQEAFLNQLRVLVGPGMWRMLYYCKPANIVEAFIKTMEAK